jgi:hypothetical protein
MIVVSTLFRFRWNIGDFDFSALHFPSCRIHLLALFGAHLRFLLRPMCYLEKANGPAVIG